MVDRSRPTATAISTSPTECGWCPRRTSSPSTHRTDGCSRSSATSPTPGTSARSTRCQASACRATVATCTRPRCTTAECSGSTGRPTGRTATPRPGATTSPRDPYRLGLCMPTKLAAPYDLAVDAWGDVWTTSTSCTYVQKFSKDGIFLFGSFVGNRGTAGPGMLPNGDQQRSHNLAVDAAGNVVSGETSTWLVRQGAVPPWPALEGGDVLPVPNPAPNPDPNPDSCAESESASESRAESGAESEPRPRCRCTGAGRRSDFRTRPRPATSTSASLPPMTSA